MATLQELEDAVAAVNALAKYKREHKAECFDSDNWYDWQLNFFAKGATHTSRMVLAGNRNRQDSLEHV